MLKWLWNLVLRKEEIKDITPEELSVRVVLVSHKPELYMILWEDGVLSRDEYNLTWAKEHCRRITRNEAVEDQFYDASVWAREAH